MFPTQCLAATSTVLGPSLAQQSGRGYCERRSLCRCITQAVRSVVSSLRTVELTLIWSVSPLGGIRLMYRLRKCVISFSCRKCRVFESIVARLFPAPRPCCHIRLQSGDDFQDEYQLIAGGGGARGEGGADSTGYLSNFSCLISAHLRNCLLWLSSS
jgi:hypothetical protein